MLRASVAQNATTPIADGKNAIQNATPCSFGGAASIGPTPPAAPSPQAKSATAASPSVGAAIAASRPIACGPRIAMATLRIQNAANATATCALNPPQPGASRPTIASSARPPHQALMPNQPAPMIARASAGRCAPRVPNQSLANTGYGI